MQTGPPSDFVCRVRLAVYRCMVDHARAPRVDELAVMLEADADGVCVALDELHQMHMLVLSPGTSNIWMAMPFSAVPTRFTVQVGERQYFGNCAWDALGIPAMLHRSATVRTSCADCGEVVELCVANDELVKTGGYVHYAVPVRHWWDDVGYT